MTRKPLRFTKSAPSWISSSEHESAQATCLAASLKEASATLGVFATQAPVMPVAPSFIPRRFSPEPGQSVAQRQTAQNTPTDPNAQDPAAAQTPAQPVPDPTEQARQEMQAEQHAATADSAQAAATESAKQLEQERKNHAETLAEHQTLGLRSAQSALDRATSQISSTLQKAIGDTKLVSMKMAALNVQPGTELFQLLLPDLILRRELALMKSAQALELGRQRPELVAWRILRTKQAEAEHTTLPAQGSSVNNGNGIQPTAPQQAPSAPVPNQAAPPAQPQQAPQKQWTAPNYRNLNGSPYDTNWVGQQYGATAAQQADSWNRMQSANSARQNYWEEFQKPKSWNDFQTHWGNLQAARANTANYLFDATTGAQERLVESASGYGVPNYGAQLTPEQQSANFEAQRQQALASQSRDQTWMERNGLGDLSDRSDISSNMVGRFMDQGNAPGNTFQQWLFNRGRGAMTGATSIGPQMADINEHIQQQGVPRGLANWDTLGLAGNVLDPIYNMTPALWANPISMAAQGLELGNSPSNQTAQAMYDNAHAPAPASPIANQPNDLMASLNPLIQKILPSLLQQGAGALGQGSPNMGYEDMGGYPQMWTPGQSVVPWNA